ncbi:YopX family protein [Bacteroides acidifaciens]|uniref:YopX family protein n=1 Tax=Bacteroides acidifaciens TaxID=85831 RepID=UPI0025AF4219|nr:YopX family protein [Bacteroides acidifaciens]
MRKIIFRAKKTADKEWVLGGYVQAIQTDKETGFNKDTHFVMENNGLANEVDPETVCQYTGLTDKNGRKIFEGDICDFSVFDYNGSDTKYKGVVVYTGSRFMLWKSEKSEYYGSDGGFDLDWVVGQDDEFEIIGNIFYNPELIGD